MMRHPPDMSAATDGSRRAETDASLWAERQRADHELARRVVDTEPDPEAEIRRARESADRLLAAARAAADARLPLGEQAKAAVALLLEQSAEEGRIVSAERGQVERRRSDALGARREKLASQLVLERQTTDLRLALERRSADEAVSSREDFLAQVSHDLGGLMAAQKIYVALLLKEGGHAEHGRQLAPHVAALSKIGAQMDRLISDLVDVVAIEAGKLAVTLRLHWAGELLATAAAVFEPIARERRQCFSVAPAPQDLRVMADAARAIQVLGNLLSNAIKFTPRDGEIRVGFEPNGDEVTFFVADTGPGVPAEQAEHIFERFVGSRSSSAGLGLGLFIADRLVSAHGGRLCFESAPGRGAVFRFTLKRAPVESR
jgi:signal transduction histidine kinase